MGRQAVRPDSLSTGHERAFIALVPDAMTASTLASFRCVLPQTGMIARPYEPEDLHLTLAFLGHLDCDKASAILSALNTMAAPLPTLTCIGQAWWPNAQRPRVHVMRYGLPPALRSMFQSVQSLVKRLELPIDTRPFQPHITLARIHASPHHQPIQTTSSAHKTIAEGAQTMLDQNAARVEFNAHMQAIGLFCRNTNGGPLRYRSLGQFPLDAAGS